MCWLIKCLTTKEASCIRKYEIANIVFHIKLLLVFFQQSKRDVVSYWPFSTILCLKTINKLIKSIELRTRFKILALPIHKLWDFGCYFSSLWIFYYFIVAVKIKWQNVKCLAHCLTSSKNTGYGTCSFLLFPILCYFSL